ncbi:Putative heterokaryon incompatibility [Colletotrichum destructivum]|uniref:Heterokaryon incompatibility n=1 Tax=Colletotrichum destructivum TaxID=34406 RepID=A0AAX4IGA4_9PEZI|nr:Putative heterokaryon incompatibility [Colletotrichum destructivum]
MALFEYEPLDLGVKSFRLLMLHPGAGGEVACDIFQASLEPEDIIPYEALSYAWGSNDLSESITVNRRRLPITKSLFHAMNHLRRDTGRILWVDAVCIDQSNVAERGHQVGQMGDVYREAEQVLIWLGPSSYETKILMDFLRALYRDTSRQKDAGDLSRAQENWLSAQQDTGIGRAALLDIRRQGLTSLLEEPWFTRVWILQEVSHARAASVCCGRWTVPAYMLSSAATLVGVDPSPQCRAVLDLMPNPFTRRSAKTKTLHTLLREFRVSRASDPRDMVYALLGIASDIPLSDPNGLLLPDYSKTEAQLVQDLQAFLFFGDVAHQLGNINNLRAFLALLPSLTDQTCRDSIAGGRVEDVKKFLRGGGQLGMVDVPSNALSSVKNERGRLFVRDLSQFRNPNLMISGSGLESLFEQLDLREAKTLLDLCGGNLRISGDFVTAFRWNGRKRSNTKVLKFLLRQENSGVQVTQAGFAEMAAFCDAKTMSTVIERQEQRYRITSRLSLMAYLNEKHGRDIMTMLLTWKDKRVRVTKPGLLKTLELNDADVVGLLRWRGVQSVRVTGTGTNPADPESSWTSTVTFKGDSTVCRREAKEVRRKLRESWEGVIKVNVGYTKNGIWEDLVAEV